MAAGETQLDGNIILTSDGTQTIRERENVTLGHNFSFGNLWIAGGSVRYQRNLELGLQRRWQQAIAIGHKFLIARNQQALILSGIAENQERNLEGVSTNNTEVAVLANYNLYSFENPNITLGIMEASYLSLTQKDRFRSDGDVNLNWELVADFSISLRFFHSYDSKSPATNEPNIDYGFIAGLRFEF